MSILNDGISLTLVTHEYLLTLVMHEYFGDVKLLLEIIGEAK